jgi:hypothetical protein
MRLTKTLRAIVRAASLGATAVLISGAAHAATAGGGMPWEGPLTAVLDSITGPVARIVARSRHRVRCGELLPAAGWRRRRGYSVEEKL